MIGGYDSASLQNCLSWQEKNNLDFHTHGHNRRIDLKNQERDILKNNKPLMQTAPVGILVP